MDMANQCLWHSGVGPEERRILLTPKAFAMLRYLVEHARRLVTREEMLEALWPETYVQPEVLKSHIRDIRAALGDDARSPRFIETLPRRGYRFIAQVNDPIPPKAQIANASNGKLVGRDRELGNLTEYLRRTLQDQQQIVFVTGEAGIGKTALVEHFQRQALADIPGIRIACGQCIEGYGGKEAYYPMLEALGQLCRAPGGESIIQLLSAQAPTWLVQFPTFMKRERPEILRRETWGATRERMLREIGEVLEAISSKGALLLVFEDLHWVDHSTVDLISALARHRTSSKLMLIGTYRPVDVVLAGHPLNALKQDLLVHQLCHEVALEPLGEAEVATYLADPSDAPPPEGLVRLVHRHSEGNPLFMVAALEHMAGRGFILHEKGSWKLKVAVEEIDLEVPENLRQMIEVQIEHLTTEEQRALEVASITVAGFSPSVNASAANLDLEHFEELCEELSRRYHIVRSAGSQRFPNESFSPRYEFVHSLYRQVFYRRQSPGRRAKLHRSVGERLETLYDGHLSDVAPELANHYEEGSDWQRAVKYLRLVAETAGRRFALAEAAKVLHRALELCGQISDVERAVAEPEILEKLASIYAVSFDMRVIETYEALRARAAFYGLLDVQVRALVDMAYPLSWISTQRCLEVIEQALQLNARQTDPITSARTRASCMVRRVWARGWNAQDAEDCRKALAEIREAADSLTLSWDLLDCNFIQWCSTEYREAQRNSVESLAILLKEYDNNPFLSHAYWLSQFILPLTLLFLGEWGEALEAIKSGIALGTRNGDRYWGQTQLICLAWVHLQARDHRGALQICESVLPALADPAHSPWNRFCRVLAGSAETVAGNHDRAIAYFLAVREEMERNTVIFDWYCSIMLDSGFTELWLAKGDLAQAQAAAGRFLEGAQKTAEHTWQARAWETNARVAVAQNDSQRAQVCITNALSAMEGYEVPLAHWRVHGTAFELYRRMGDKKAAEEHRQLSGATIMKLANSMPTGEPLRGIFLSAPAIRRILADEEASANPA
jgi:DNA-binding winged helix-turn-helix (wHTH) protein